MYIKATISDAETITQLVQNTIKTIYPKYYPTEVVEFFLQLHSYDSIAKDIEDGLVGILIKDDVVVGTGCYRDNHITRVYVDPSFQKQGFGSCIMQYLEDEIAKKYDKAVLDSSLPASHLYQKRGYKTITHEKYAVDNDVVLVYEIMEKSFVKTSTTICYDGKIFVPRENTENGEVGGNTVFEYHQNDNIMWAEYSGGGIIKGHMIGTVAEKGELDFYYQHINNKNELRVGVCHSVPEILENGKIELHEKWKWINGDKSEGASVVIEN